MKLTVYWYPRCGTCRNAVKWLEAKGHELEKMDLYEAPPAKDRLKELYQKSGLELKKFLNTSGQVYREMKLKDRIPQMSEEEILELLASDGRLVKRPIVTDGERVTVGFQPERFEEVWG
jgi:arsenate reductase